MSGPDPARLLHRRIQRWVVLGHGLVLVFAFVVGALSHRPDHVVTIRVNLVSLAGAGLGGDVSLPGRGGGGGGAGTARPAPAPKPPPGPKAGTAAPPPKPVTPSPKAAGAVTAQDLADPKRAPKSTATDGTWRARTPEEIRKAASLNKKPTRRQQVAAQLLRDRANHPSSSPDADEIADRLGDRVSNIKVRPLTPIDSTPGPTGGSGPGDGTGGGTGGGGVGVAGGGGGGGVPSYFALVTATLYRMWQQPSSAEMGKQRPTAGVDLTVRIDGKVVAARVSRPSGVAAMDRSVEDLLRRLDSLPLYSQFGIRGENLQFEVSFELD